MGSVPNAFEFETWEEDCIWREVYAAALSARLGTDASISYRNEVARISADLAVQAYRVRRDKLNEMDRLEEEKSKNRYRSNSEESGMIRVIPEGTNLDERV